MFETAETFYRAVPGVTAAERATALHGRPQDIAAMMAAGKRAPSSTKVQARAEHGRWLVDCPDPTCQGCQYASADDPRFFCNYCHNAAAGVAWVPVVWPKGAAAIEEVLAERPDPRTRNWFPHETLANLRDENAEFHSREGR